VIVGELVVLPKHYWTGKDAKGRPRDISQTTLEAPPGSGPYKIVQVIPGRSIVYQRVKNYWAKDLPVKIAATISTRCASTITATRRSRSKR